MTAEQALVLIRGYAAANRVEISGHAMLRLRQRGGRPADAVHALAHGARCVDQRADHGRAGDWRVDGPDLEGDELTCVVVIEDDVIVLTVF